MRNRPSRQKRNRTCRQCGNDYEAEFGAKDWLCSPQCKVRGRVVVDPNTGCWDSTLAPDGDGYTHLQTGSRNDGTRRKVLFHRYSYEAFNGPIPEDQKVCHICDRPICVAPRHLFLGNDQDNATDSMLKGRKRKKLRPGDIREIRKLREEGAYVLTIAAKFKISWSQVYHILSGKQWGHVR